MPGFRSYWGSVKPEKREPRDPLPIIAKATVIAPETPLTLRQQLGHALKARREAWPEGKLAFDEWLHVHPRDSQRWIDGYGLRVDSLERIGRRLGWRVTVTDPQGKVIAQS